MQIYGGGSFIILLHTKKNAGHQERNVYIDTSAYARSLDSLARPLCKSWVVVDASARFFKKARGWSFATKGQPKTPANPSAPYLPLSGKCAPKPSRPAPVIHKYK